MYDRNALAWTSADVLSDVRRKASLPATSSDYPDAVILREATSTLWSFAAWALAQAGEGRLVVSLDRPLTAVLAGAYRAGSEVALPALAVADTVQHVTWIDATGEHQSRLVLLDQAQEPDYDRPLAEGSPGGYALIDGRIRLYPRPTSGGLVRITYQRRHPELVLDTAAYTGTVQSGAAASATTTTLTLLGAITGLTADQEVDVVTSFAPHRTLASSLNVTAVNGADVTVAAPLSTFDNLPLVGARVVRAGQSPYVQLPLELRNAFTQKCAAEIMRDLGDLAGAQAAEQSALLELSRVIQMLSPRAKRDRPKAINPFSHLRSIIRRGRL